MIANPIWNKIDVPELVFNPVDDSRRTVTVMANEYCDEPIQVELTGRYEEISVTLSMAEAVQVATQLLTLVEAARKAGKVTSK